MDSLFLMSYTPSLKVLLDKGALMYDEKMQPDAAGRRLHYLLLKV